MMMDIQIQDRLKLPLYFEPGKLKEDLSKINDEEWIDHFNQGGYEGIWKILPLRAPADAQHPIQSILNMPGQKEFVDTEFKKRCSYLSEVMDQFECPLRTVRLMRLTAGSVIKPHRDMDLSFEHGEVRIHVPVVTSNKVKFYLNGKRVKMKEGECWYLRLSDPHAVANYGKEDRTHLVLDCEVNEWIKNLFHKASTSKSFLKGFNLLAVRVREDIINIFNLSSDFSCLLFLHIPQPV